MAMSLDRFLEPQDGRGGAEVTYSTALAEIRKGRKSSSWIWYVFPQYLARKGAKCEKWQIYSADEARAYLSHEVLGARYMEISEAALEHLEQCVPVATLMGSVVDAEKFHQSVNLFALAARSLSEEHAHRAEVLERILEAIEPEPDSDYELVDPKTAERWADENRPTGSASMAMSLDRFHKPQDGRGGAVTYSTALSQIRRGQKSSCWIWYVFPQYLAGSSANCKKWQIFSADEAREYLSHEVLGARYMDISQAALEHLEQGVPVARLMGSVVDAEKFHQSVSLFALAARSLGEGHTQRAEVLQRILEAIETESDRFERVDPMTAKRWADENEPTKPWAEDTPRTVCGVLWPHVEAST